MTLFTIPGQLLRCTRSTCTLPSPLDVAGVLLLHLHGVRAEGDVQRRVGLDALAVPVVPADASVNFFTMPFAVA